MMAFRYRTTDVQLTPSEGGKRNGVHLKALLDLIGRRPASKKRKRIPEKGQNLHVTLHNITTIWIRTHPHLGVFEMKFYPFFLGSVFHFCQGLGFWNRFSCGQTIGSPHYKDDSEFTQSHPTTKPNPLTLVSIKYPKN